MSICDNCIHDDVCGLEDSHEEAITFCADMMPKDKYEEWIPIKTRPLTEKEKEYFVTDAEFIYECDLPDDGETVLITDKWGNVETDTFYRDDGCYFEDNCGEDDVIAWMPLPEPYMAESEETETWNGIHAQITAPKGTFERIFNDADDDNDI